MGGAGLRLSPDGQHVCVAAAAEGGGIVSSGRVSAVLQRLAHARKQAGLTQAQAGKLIGLSTSGFCDVEVGRNPLTLERFFELCDLYDVNETWALTGVNPDFDPQQVIEKLGESHADLGAVLDLLQSTQKAAQP